MLRHVDLCSGIGGFALGFQWAELSRPVLFCDIEPYSRKVLRKHWPDVPIAKDVKELANDPDGLIPECDIITAGYPCQPFSLAGERRGTEDDRHIWPYILSIVKAKRPSWCVFENVYGHVSMGLDEVLSDLEGQGYAARPFIVPACAADAPHRRDRVWIIARNVAYADSQRLQRSEKARDTCRSRKGRKEQPSRRSEIGVLAHADSEPREAQHNG
ncbi:MAG: DNA cytosine methyltransferase, partial [Paracoccaceae bacterium]